MENKSVIKLKQTSLEWGVDFYTRHGMKFEIHQKENIIELHVWHESMWSPQIVESVHYYDKNGKEIYDDHWHPK